MGAHPSRLRYANHPTEVARIWPRLPTEALRVLRLCDGTRSRQALNADSGLPVPLLDRVLGRLEQEGLIRRIEGRRDPAALPQSARDWLHRRRPEPEPEPSILDSQPLGQPTSEIEDTDFTCADESFFSMSIDHLLEPEERASLD